MKSLVIFYIILLLATNAYADFETYRGVRQMGMGGAAIAVVNDETSVFTNPNGLGRLRDYFYTFADPELTGSIGGFDALVDTGVFGTTTPRTLYEALEVQKDKPYYFKGQVFPSIVVPNFGIGVYKKYEILAQRNLDDSYEFNYQHDMGLAAAYNLRFFDGRFKVGFTGRYLNRVEFFGTRGAADPKDLESISSEGAGVAVDAGVTLAAPWQWLPTLAAVVRDVGGTTFSLSEGFLGVGVQDQSPNYVPQSMDVAVAVFPIMSNHVRSTWTIEYTGIDTMSEVDEHTDRLHIGAEINMYDAYFFRGGHSSGHWTAGFEYAMEMFQVQLASYAEEVDFGAGPKVDRRYIIKLAFRR